MDLQSVKLRFGIIGNSGMLNTALQTAVKVAPTDMNVLIQGESGAGKESFSKVIHQLSSRKHQSFIAVNCGAIPEGTIDSELFGHEKGAFTGASEKRKGYFESVNGGTLFLDEIGDMSLSAQAKVLRALQENRIQRVGSDKSIKVDVRVIAATNKDLKKEIEEGRFREDLYHRLAVILIEVPALNDRRDDIPLLVNFFSTKIASEQGTALKQFSKTAMELLKSYNWTGNIRELRNVVERLIILGANEITDNDVRAFASKS